MVASHSFAVQTESELLNMYSSESVMLWRHFLISHKSNLGASYLWLWQQSLLSRPLGNYREHKSDNWIENLISNSLYQ